MNEDGIHNGIVVKDIFNVGWLIILDHRYEFCEEFFKGKVIEEVPLVLAILGEENLELRMENNMNEVVHEAVVEASLSFNLVAYP